MPDPTLPASRLDYQASIDRPRLVLPEGKRLAVFLVVNVEAWDITRAMPPQGPLAFMLDHCALAGR